MVYRVKLLFSVQASQAKPDRLREQRRVEQEAREGETAGLGAGGGGRQGEAGLQGELARVRWFGIAAPQAAERGAGQVFCVGQGDTGQLGLGDDVMERSRPALVAAVGQAVEVVAGGMHTVALDIHGKVQTGKYHGVKRNILLVRFGPGAAMTRAAWAGRWGRRRSASSPARWSWSRRWCRSPLATRTPRLSPRRGRSGCGEPSETAADLSVGTA